LGFVLRDGVVAGGFAGLWMAFRGLLIATAAAVGYLPDLKKFL
jgi:hypothetical protein